MKPIFPLAMMLILLGAIPLASAQVRVCAVYVTGIGCSNCAVTDPVVTSGLTAKNPDYIVIEYEIFHRNADNYMTAEDYFNNYAPSGVPHGVPFLILGDGNSYIGRSEVLGTEGVIVDMISNDCPMPDGSSVEFESLDITALSGEPNIWSKNRVLVSEGGGGDNNLLRDLIFEEDITDLLKGMGYEEVSTVPVQISGSQVNFEHAVRLDGWIFQWNGEGLDGNNSGDNGGNGNAQYAVSLYSVAAVLVIVVVGLFVYFARFR